MLAVLLDRQARLFGRAQYAAVRREPDHLAGLFDQVADVHEAARMTWYSPVRSSNSGVGSTRPWGIQLHSNSCKQYLWQLQR